MDDSRVGGQRRLFRLGDGSPSSLRPRPKDRDTGLSAFRTLEALAGHRVAVGRPLATGESSIVLDEHLLHDFTIKDDPGLEGHVLVRPADPTLMEEWLERRGTVHPLTRSLQAAIIPPRRRRVP
jgi:hypothetical protein